MEDKQRQDLTVGSKIDGEKKVIEDNFKLTSSIFLPIQISYNKHTRVKRLKAAP